MISRADAHSDFVRDFNWSSGKRFLLADMMTEHREMLEDAAHHCNKYIQNGFTRHRERFDQLLAGSELLACAAEMVAFGEATEKLLTVQRVTASRKDRLYRTTAGRRLP